MDLLLTTLLNGLSYGLLLFMLSSGLTLVFSMMGVLNFAHASFYMLGAYVAYTLAPLLGFWVALIVTPLVAGMLGALFEQLCLRRVHASGHLAELLITFGLSYVLLELVQLAWGRSSVDYRVPEALAGSLQTAGGLHFPLYRVFMMGVALAMLAALWWLLVRTRVGLVIQAALTHPQMVEALGHDLPRVYRLVFGGGCAFAGLAGGIGGNAFVTEPGMAAGIGALLFVVIVIGGLGSLAGAFVGSLLIGLLQTFAVAVDASPADALAGLGLPLAPDGLGAAVLGLKLSQLAPVLPYLLLVLMLVVRPRGLLGTRET